MQTKMLNAQHVKRQVSKVKQVNHGRDVKIPDTHVLPVKRRRLSIEKMRLLSLVVSPVRHLTKWSAGQTLDREGPGLLLIKEKSWTILPFTSHQLDNQWMKNQFFSSIVQHCLK